MPWKILYVGPVNFHAESWRTRAEYILPDLFASAGSDVHIHLLTGPVPDFARAPLEALLQRFDVRHRAVPAESRGANRIDHWREEVTAHALAIRADVVTNLFGSQWLGEVIATAAKRARARSIIRVAGDEIGSRVALGVYKNDSARHQEELAQERAGFVACDLVVAMSPWEAERIRKAIGTPTDKVKVCIRGVDLQRFTPAERAPGQKRTRFLYVGRKSAEKGYDLIEEAARKVHAIEPAIEFVFVGDFQPQRVENRHYLGWVETAELPQLFRSVDAFALTSRSEGFPQAVAEAMAAGLPSILSEHLFGTVFRHGEDALLCSLSPDDIAAQVLKLAREPALADRLAARARAIAERTLDQAVWKGRTEAIMHLRPFTEGTLFDARPEPAAGRRRLLFVTPRPLGALATPGTYLSVEAYAEHCDVHVVCKPSKESDIIVHQPRKDFPVTVLDPQEPDFGEELAKLMRAYRPDIVCFGSWPGLAHLIRPLRQLLPKAVFCLEVKSPQLNQDQRRREQNTAAWQRVQNTLDAVIAPARGMAESYLPDLQVPFKQHRSIIDYEALEKKAFDGDRVLCRRFVFSGSLAKLRQLDRLVQLIGRLPAAVREGISVDFYGDGDAREELEALVARLGLASAVRFLGAIPQAELFRRYRDYDAGLAWVPRALYDSAPSLKLIEYCASGIAPVATSSEGHLLLKGHGFAIDYFEEEDAESFLATMTRMFQEGVPAQQLRDNIAQAAEFDYRSVIGNEILPFYFSVAEGKASRHSGGTSPVPSSTAAHPKLADALPAWRTQALHDAELDLAPLRSAGGLAYERALHGRRMKAGTSPH